ncbi:olfactory receptor 14A2-like [Talpa occidentalis]|uniref:olfactory receptor 14A2-like n=1 Tax=Talpa occidentalis TaxID=50954 RepID=UPI00188F1489|nr:olfactory receptor 14A2-like [Talpa occidentalis]
MDHRFRAQPGPVFLPSVPVGHPQEPTRPALAWTGRPSPEAAPRAHTPPLRAQDLPSCPAQPGSRPVMKAEPPAGCLGAPGQEAQAMANLSAGAGFILLQLSGSPRLQLLHGCLFLLLYLLALAGNLLVAALVSLDARLHSPMYLLLRQLSLLDAGLVSVTVPKSALGALAHSAAISRPGCALQVLLVIHFAGAELLLLTAMAYDRYAAICRPLHYEGAMSRAVCARMAAASWALGGVFGGLYAGGTFSLSFCGPRTLPQLFCDVPSLLRIACPQSHVTIDASVAAGVLYGFLCLLAIVVSYVRIFSTVLALPSAQGRAKAFSTCLPHLAVVSTFLLTGAAAYLKPVPECPSLLDVLVSVSYSVLPPTLNPAIYTLRNRDVRAALSRLQACGGSGVPARWT